MRQDDVVPAAVRRLPPGALAGLRDAFAGEVAERLPRLREAVRAGDESALTEALRDAHALGSSAAVVGEVAASRCARDTEALLMRRPQEPDADLLPLLRARVDELHDCLAGWLP